MNTRQIPGRDKIGSLTPGKYTQFEGTEISIENCVKAKVKDLVVEGKTYQNLCIEDTTNEISSLNFSNYSMFKTGTYYTIIFEITVDNASQINLAFNTSSHVLVSPKGHNKGIYKFKVRNTNTSLGEISSVKLVSLNQEGYTTCLFKNVIVLEGDYTNIDIPTFIDGIESVGERENNVLNIVNSGKNLIDTSKITRWKQQPNSLYHLEYPFLIRVKENTNYVTNLEMNCIYFLNQDRTIIDQSFNNKAGTFKTPVGCKFIQIRTWGTESSKTPIYPEDYAKFQLEEGTVATSYESYREPSVTTLNLPIPLRSLPDGTCDTIEGNKLIQRVGKVIFDGSADESWGNGYIPDGINNRFQITKRIELDGSSYGSRLGYCDHFSVVINNSIPPVGSMRMTFTKEVIYFLFNPSTDIVPLENLSAWKTWLSENPVTVYYELATPIIHDLEIPQLSTTKGTNVITTTNNIKPNLKMKVKVKK